MKIVVKQKKPIVVNQKEKTILVKQKVRTIVVRSMSFYVLIISQYIEEMSSLGSAHRLPGLCGSEFWSRHIGVASMDTDLTGHYRLIDGPPCSSYLQLR